MEQFEQEYVLVNGIQQYVLHYPKAPGAPVLLFLHGGPGQVESLFAYQLDATWGDMFTHVHWDQRGAGKTLRRNQKRGVPQSLEQMLDDLHGIVGHLQQKYHVDKIVLLGHSWGSLLGSLYVHKHPENVLCYIGVGQVVCMMENERAGYQKALELAQNAGNQKHLKALANMGDYPPADPALLLTLMPKLRSIQAAYEEDAGSGLGEMLKTMRRSPCFQWQDIVSLLRMTGANRALVLSLLSFDLRAFPSRYAVPMHYILGEADTITPTALTQAYYETMDAPEKSITVIAKAGHDPVYEQPKEFAAALRRVRDAL